MSTVSILYHAFIQHRHMGPNPTTLKSIATLRTCRAIEWRDFFVMSSNPEEAHHWPGFWRVCIEKVWSSIDYIIHGLYWKESSRWIEIGWNFISYWYVSMTIDKSWLRSATMAWASQWSEPGQACNQMVAATKRESVRVLDFRISCRKFV